MLYLSSSAIKETKIADILRLCVENEVYHIELSGGTSYYEEIWGDLCYWQEKAGLQYACHAYFPPPKQDFVVNLASCNDEIYERSLQHYLDCIKHLSKLNCPVLSMHAGFLVEVGVEQIGGEIKADIIYDRGTAIDRFCCAYRTIRQEADKYGICLYLENNVLNKGNYERFQNHNYFLMTDYESIMELEHELEFNLLLDLGHLYVSSQTLNLDFQEEIRNIKKHVKWLHISENNGIEDQHRVLTKRSPVYYAFLQFVHSHINMTLEAKGSVEEIIKNYQWINVLIEQSR